mgnify:CR=1 FL=1
MWAACAGVRPTTPPDVSEITSIEPPVAPVATALPVREVPARSVRELGLPQDWKVLSDEAFDATLAQWTKDGASLRLSDTDLAELGRALGASDASSARAAVILGNTRDARAFEPLVQRLEARVPEGGRELSGDVVAAAACASVAPSRAALARVEALAVGARPHPALRVRVECALTCLALGRTAVVPFLLDVLREGTSAASKNTSWRRLDWTDEGTLRLQDRIGRAVSDAAGIECLYRARGPLAVREREIARLARHFQANPPAK